MGGTKKSIREESFLYVEQSQAGVFTLPFQDNAGSKTSCIGTLDCWNCVGVYIPIDKDICFAAHIDAWVKTPTRSELGMMIPPKGTETDLKDQVKAMLTQRVLPFMPSGGLDDESKDRCIIVNMRPTIAFQGISVPSTGLYIAEAIQEWFGLYGVSEDMHAHGFVVNHATAEKEFFRWNGNAPAPTVHDYDKYEAQSRETGVETVWEKEETLRRQYPSEERLLTCSAAGDWKFGCHEGRWYTWREMQSNGFLKW